MSDQQKRNILRRIESGEFDHVIKAIVYVPILAFLLAMIHHGGPEVLIHRLKKIVMYLSGGPL